MLVFSSAISVSYLLPFLTPPRSAASLAARRAQQAAEALAPYGDAPSRALPVRLWAAHRDVAAVPPVDARQMLVTWRGWRSVQAQAAAGLPRVPGAGKAEAPARSRTAADRHAQVRVVAVKTKVLKRRIALLGTYLQIRPSCSLKEAARRAPSPSSSFPALSSPSLTVFFSTSKLIFSCPSPPSPIGRAAPPVRPPGGRPLQARAVRPVRGARVRGLCRRADHGGRDHHPGENRSMITFAQFKCDG
jgi:hypothetical protein